MAGEMNDGEGMRVQLARMEGKLDMSNMRHEQAASDITEIKGRLHNHSNAITEIRARQHLQDGERKGVALTGGIVKWIIGLIGGAGIATGLMRLFGG